MDKLRHVKTDAKLDIIQARAGDGGSRNASLKFLPKQATLIDPKASVVSIKNKNGKLQNGLLSPMPNENQAQAHLSLKSRKIQKVFLSKKSLDK